MRTPFQQQQSQVNTYGVGPSISDTPEAKDFLGLPLNFGDYSGLRTDVDVDPGVGRRTDLAEQSARNRWDSAFMGGVPREYRTLLRDSELRQIRGQGAAEAQQAQYAAKMGARDLEYRKAGLIADTERAKTLADLDRRRLLLPQVVQTGGSGTSSGFNTQVTAPQPGFLQSFGSGLSAGLGGAIPFI